jgi:hypothetical protein
MLVVICCRFYLIGHGLPFYYAVRGARTILFDSLENKMVRRSPPPIFSPETKEVPRPGGGGLT